MSDILGIVVIALSLGLSCSAIVTSRRAVASARADWVRRGPHDPRYEAAVRAKLSKGENRQLTRLMGSTKDMNVKVRHGLSMAEWNALTDRERAEKRESVAQHFNQENP